MLTLHAGGGHASGYAGPAPAQATALGLEVHSLGQLPDIAGSGAAPVPAVSRYHGLGALVAWQARPGPGPAPAGRHLLQARYPESGTAGLRQLAERHVFASATLRF